MFDKFYFCIVGIIKYTPAEEWLCLGILNQCLRHGWNNFVIIMVDDIKSFEWRVLNYVILSIMNNYISCVFAFDIFTNSNDSHFLVGALLLKFVNNAHVTLAKYSAFISMAGNSDRNETYIVNIKNKNVNFIFENKKCDKVII